MEGPTSAFTERIASATAGIHFGIHHLLLKFSPAGALAATATGSSAIEHRTDGGLFSLVLKSRIIREGYHET